LYRSPTLGWSLGPFSLDPQVSVQVHMPGLALKQTHELEQWQEFQKS
jgi:hypothetical protein